MKIYLYLASKILTFSLPQKVMGSFSFDENIDEESKLINIDAKDGLWYINSTSDVSIIENGEVVESLPLKQNNFYTLKKDEKTYFIYAADSFDDSLTTYKYKEIFKLSIGNNNTSNVRYNSPYLQGTDTLITINDGKIVEDCKN